MSRVLSILKWVVAAILAAGAVIAGILTLRGWRDADPGDDVRELARNNREDAEADADRGRTEAESEAERRAAIREVEAREMARLAAADDDGDPDRVLERHSSGAAGDGDS